jgi:hypothetical protein
MRAGSFKIARNQGVNLANPKVAEVLPSFPHPELVASTFSLENNRMVPGISATGPRVISFDSILKYGRYPVAQILTDVMQICREAMMCDIEIEFAADIKNRKNRQELVIKLLQVRPVAEFGDEKGMSIEKAEEMITNKLVTSTKALGSGFFDGMTHIISVPSKTFDSSRTREMAAEIAELNNKLKEEGASYLLVGPGRWGSSDPWLGIPVVWSDISEAKMIVETAIPGYRIEPSQGTHFFQNITSLGVGYLTIDTVYGDGTVDEEAFAGLECIHDGQFVKLYKAPEGLSGFIDRQSNKSIIGY